MKREQGFIGYIILIIISLIFLKYFFNWSIFEAASTPQGKETVSYTQNVISNVWSHLSVPFHFFWDKILAPTLKLIWNSFEDFIIYTRKVGSAK